MPALSTLHPITFPDPVAQFIQKATTTAGARLIELPTGADLNQAVHEAYPQAQIFASNLPGIDVQLNPDTVAEARELTAVEVGIVQGCIGVAENACIWVPQAMKERAICFASENLVILLQRQDIVNNMHEAYARISGSEEYFRNYKFGTFISGPSKTADIESALVYGAQAARSLTIILT
jgi:L-lactate dehydrogenase complex protein LldG